MSFKMTGENRTVTVYNLRADTYEFIGKGDAFIPAHTGLPANCTMSVPPETKKGFIPVFDTETQRWNISEDHRGEIVFDTETGNQFYITELGAYPSGTTTIAPSYQWQKWDGDAWVLDATAERTALVSEAQTTKSNSMKMANEIIATLQDAVDFDMATEEEKTRLITWKKYRVLLNRIQPEDMPDIEWPQQPE
ncbi:tail fiber assembly protein [Vagococcus sp. WN89Y]|uniref:tail fiber assembly protein n=1 Tax=Vagococcus sp. WN89Y TaxID=3457258 RepID=UPI003FCD5922